MILLMASLCLGAVLGQLQCLGFRLALGLNALSRAAFFRASSCSTI